MARFLQPHVDRDATRAAITDERGSTSWGDFNARVNQIIAAFRREGVAAGDVIAVFAGNCREYYELMAAANHSGVLYVPINWHFTSDELDYVVNDSQAKLLFVEDRFAEVAEPVTSVPTIVIRGDAGGLPNYESWFGNESINEPDDQAMGGPMFYTSGTTGRPKGVRSSGASGPPPLEMLEMMANGMSGMLSIPGDGNTFICGPVYHSAQWAFSFLPLLAGSHVVMRHKFDAAEALSIIDQENITNVHLVPTQFSRMLKLDDATRAGFTGKTLQVVWHGAAPCPPEVKRCMIDWWGEVVSEYYGSTEGSIVSMCSAAEWLERPGTVGKPSPTVEIRVVDENGDALGANESGEIYVKNLMGTDFEYHNEPEKTKAVHLEPGVFTFGDIGYFDDDGYLYLSDRKIDMIISGGVNIYPAEIEGVLATHPAVSDVAVFGIPHEEFGEEVKAAVTLQAGQSGSPELSEELIAFCREQLAGYKAPKSIDYIDEMPRHETGKLYKRLLKDKYWEGTGRTI